MMFNKNTPIKSYFCKVSNFLVEKLNEYIIEQLVEYSDQELNDYFIENYKIEQISYDLSKKSKTMKKTQVSEYNRMYNRIPYQQEYNMVDALEFTFSIPVIEGEINLLIYSPNTEVIYMDGGTDATYRINDSTNCIEIIFTIANHILNDIDEDKLNEYIENQFLQNSQRLFSQIEYINSDIIKFNDKLINVAKNNIALRKKDYDFTNKIIKNTGIELVATNQMAQTGTKICLRPKVKKDPPQFPNKKAIIEEYSLDDNQYRMIMDYIFNYLSSAEINPLTIAKLDEEDIRNCILWALSTNFTSSSGETFRKSGKTDICISFKEKDAFIAECKLWKGEKVLLEAIDQLDSYTTWRDVRTTLLFFNKDRINFDNAINAFVESIKKHSRYISMKEIKKNYVECKFKNRVGNNPVTISFIISNFYVD